MSGKSDWNKTGKMLHKEEPKKEVEKEAIEPIRKEEMAKYDENFAKMLESDAREEAERLGGIRLPYLRIFVANKSTALLVNGEEPKDGNFYYVPTKKEYESVECHILHISKGFRMEALPDENGVIKTPYTHMVTGIITNDPEDYVPFVLTIQGQARLAAVWDFQKILSKERGGKVPTYAMKVVMTTEKVKIKDNKGIERTARIPKFEWKRDENGNIEYITDPKLYQLIRSKLAELESLVNSHIQQVRTDDPETDQPQKINQLAEENKNKEKEEVIPTEKVKIKDNEEQVSYEPSDDMPF